MTKVNRLVVREGSASDFGVVYPFLLRDFPPEELKGRPHFERLLAGRQYKLYVATHATLEVLIGYALIFEPKSPKIAWLDYIAIDPRHRDVGYGAAFFTQLCEMMRERRKGIMLEVEPATSEDPTTLLAQRRRIVFYNRLSAKQLDVEYLFPSYAGPQSLLLFYRPIDNAQALSARDLRAIIKAAYSFIHSDVRDKDAMLARLLDGVHDQRF